MSFLPLLTVSALALLGPVAMLVLPRRRRRLRVVSAGRQRWVLHGVATAGVVLGAFAVSLALGSAAVTAGASATVLGAAVLGWAPLTRTWPVLGVTVWGLVVAAVTGLVASAVALALAASAVWAAVLVSGVGAAVLVPALGMVRHRLRDALGVRAGARRAVRVPVYLQPWVLRPAIALGVFVAAFSVTGLTGEGPGAGRVDARETDRGPRPAPDNGVGSLDPSGTQPVGATFPGPVGVTARPTGEPSPSTGVTARPGSTGATAGPTRSLRTGAYDDSSGGSTTQATSAPGTASTSPSAPALPGEDPAPAEEPPTATVTELADPVTDTVEEVTDPVTETVPEVTEPVQEVTDPVTGPVTSTVEEVTDPVTDPVTGPVTSTVEELTDPATSLLP